MSAALEAALAGPPVPLTDYPRCTDECHPRTEAHHSAPEPAPAPAVAKILAEKARREARPRPKRRRK